MTDRSACIALFGTGSDVGKSVAAAALCRIYNDIGLKVAPFKTQNMSNNSFVTSGGGEMGRAQVVQAECARIEPHVDMNPLLLKPSANCRSQMVLHGVATGDVSSLDFRSDRSVLFEKLMASMERLRSEYELIVIEGAGSDAAVIKVKGTKKALAISVDCNGRYCYLNPYNGAMMAVAEAARETEWKLPSFAAKIFDGGFQWDLIYPYPEQTATDRRVGDEYLAKLEQILKEHLDADEVDKTGIIPDKVYDALAAHGCFSMKILGTQ